MDFKDYYSALGVERTASADEIRKAYRKLARKYHPDVSQEVNAEARKREVNEANDVLHDPEKRAAYDALYERVKSGRAAGSGVGNGGFQPPPGWDEGFEFRRPSEHGGPADHAEFSDFFSSLFGAAERRCAGRKNMRARGEDHHAAIEVPLELALAGGEREITLRALETNAQGVPEFVERTLRVNIPRGIHPGQYIRLAGQGLPGHGGEAAGDLYLEVRIAPHSLFRIDGRDVVMTLPITPSEAALGAEVEVPLPGGGQGAVRVPPQARAGLKLRLKDRGLGGHLYLLLEIVVPSADSDAARAAYEQLAKATTDFNPRRSRFAASRGTGA